jgi:hypothetical protein
MLRICALILTACCLVLPLSAFADDKKEDAAVKEIDLKGAKFGLPKGKADMPTVLKSAEELAKAIPDVEVQAKVKKEVDFAKQQLLFFAWSGSGGDRLAYNVEKGEKGPLVVFLYTRGLTRDLRGHVHLFALPKDATWKVVPAK